MDTSRIDAMDKRHFEESFELLRQTKNLQFEEMSTQISDFVKKLGDTIESLFDHISLLESKFKLYEETLLFFQKENEALKQSFVHIYSLLQDEDEYAAEEARTYIRRMLRFVQK